jgi:hypothetical protein
VTTRWSSSEQEFMAVGTGVLQGSPVRRVISHRRSSLFSVSPDGNFFQKQYLTEKIRTRLAPKK